MCACLERRVWLRQFRGSALLALHPASGALGRPAAIQTDPVDDTCVLHTHTFGGHSATAAAGSYVHDVRCLPHLPKVDGTALAPRRCANA